MVDFKEIMRQHQINWRRSNLPFIIKNGQQNKKEYEHLLPREDKINNFYPEIQTSLFQYLSKNNIQPHSGIHNLLSSWALCANLYWPFNNSEGFELLRNYFNERIKDIIIKKITAIELEYLDPDPDLSPHRILGEDEGNRGSGQTSPDLAILFETDDEKRGILLIESKFTEHSFYVCSANKTSRAGKPVNPDKNRCKDANRLINSRFSDCHLKTWGRKYWELLHSDLDINVFIGLKGCPAATSCYQMLRQHALAKGYKSKYDIVISCVAYDERNTKLINSPCSLGLKPFPDGWKELFPKLSFHWFSHQSWYQFLKQNDNKGVWRNWINYVGERYQY